MLSYAGLGIAGGSASIGGHMSYAQCSGASHASTAAQALDTDWMDLGPLDDFPEGRPTLRTGTASKVAVPLAVVRRGSRVDAFVGACSHLSGPLHEGTVEDVRGAAAWSARGTARRSTWTTASPGGGPRPTRRRSSRCAWRPAG